MPESTHLTVTSVLLYPARPVSSSSSTLHVRIQHTLKGNAFFNICSLKATLLQSEHINFYLLCFYFIAESQKPILFLHLLEYFVLHITEELDSIVT